MKNSNKKSQQNKNTINKKAPIISKNRNDSLLPIIIAFCLPVLLYLQTINFGFSGFDDDVIITNNFKFLNHFGNAFKAFLTDAFIINISSFYRPLQTLSYMMDIQLSGGNNPWMYHLTNILLLGAIACSLFLLLKRFSIPPKLALLGTLIYCMHPLFVSSVAWIPARGDLMLTFFSLLSFIFFIDFLQKKKNIYLVLNWITFTIALFCKETAAVLPFIFILYFFTFNNEKRFEKKYYLIIFLFAISGIFWFWLRSKAIGTFSYQSGQVGLAAILSNLPTIPDTLISFFLPFNIDPIPSFSFLKTITGLGLIVLITIIFFKNKQSSKKEKVFYLSCFLILMFPPMLYKNPLVDYLDHRFFLPFINILLFVLLILPENWFKKGDIKGSWLLITIIVFFFCFTFIKSRSYSSPITFYNSVISHNSNSAIAYNNRGLDKGNRGEYQEAINDFNKAIDIFPNYYQAYYNRGLMKSKMGDNLGAIEDFNVAISINNNYANAYSNRGCAKLYVGNYKDAIEDFNKYIAFDPNNMDTYYNRGFAKIRLDNYTGAIEDFNKYISINSNNAKAYGSRAIAKYSIKDYIGAIEDFDKALELNPNDKTALILKTKAQQELQKMNKQEAH